MNDYTDFIRESARLCILQALYAAPAYTLNELTLKKALSSHGQALSGDVLRSMLKWLHEQSLVLAKHEDGFWVATITAQGGDVVNGLSTVPGVARPEPL